MKICSPKKKSESPEIVAKEKEKSGTVEEPEIAEKEEEKSGAGEEAESKPSGFDFLEYQKEPQLNKVVDAIVDYCKQNNITNPIEILRVSQKCIVQGRKLEIEDPATENVGPTNFLAIDRYNVFETAREEIQLIEPGDIRKTLEVSFYDELAKDLGGPRKEFFELFLQSTESTYFKQGMREDLSEDYILIGTIIALSFLQNGPIFDFGEDLDLIFRGNTRDNSICIQNLRKGMNRLGVIDLCQSLPIVIHLFRPSPSAVLSRKKLIEMLKPEFSPEGSNNRKFESETYSFFMKFIREVASGRLDNLNFEKILSFVTCSRREPLLGFSIKPTIVFSEAFGPSKWDFIPTAHTCGNILHLPVRNHNIELPSESDLMEVYISAFNNVFFGKV